MLQNIVSFITTYIIDEPFILLSLVALLGLVLQKAKIEDIIAGTIKTGIGYLIVQTGAGIIVGAVVPLSEIMGKMFNVQGGALPAVAIGQEAFIGSWGSSIGIIMVLGFIVNIILARITRFKYIYLTAHQTFWISMVYIAAAVEVFGSNLSVVWVVVIGSLLLGIYSTLSPALVQPYMRQMSGGNDIAYGHTTSFGAFLGAKLGQLFSKDESSVSTEDLNIPDRLSFLRNIAVSTAIFSTILYTVSILIVGPAWIEANVSGGVAPLLYGVKQAFTFGLGMHITLEGVRLMVGEITQAFVGISERLVPDAIPALDAPVVFSFAPNAVMIGFFVSFAVTIICMLIFGITGLFALTPPIITCYFGGGPAGVFGNSQGGWKGAVLAGIGAGLLISFGQWITVSALSTTVPDFIRRSCDFDYVIFPGIFKKILEFISSIFG